MKFCAVCFVKYVKSVMPRNGAYAWCLQGAHEHSEDHQERRGTVRAWCQALVDHGVHCHVLCRRPADMELARHVGFFVRCFVMVLAGMCVAGAPAAAGCAAVLPDHHMHPNMQHKQRRRSVREQAYVLQGPWLQLAAQLACLSLVL